MSFEWMGHHKLLRIVTISGEAVNLEPIRVGAGPGKAVFEVTDLVVLKVKNVSTGEEKPVIPGSSWKGLFRAAATMLCRSLGLNVCDGLPNATCLRGDEFYDVERRRPMDVEAKLSMLLNRNGAKACITCLMFGSPSLHSHVTFSDSTPISRYLIGYRTCVAINRRTGAAHRGALFTVEYVEPGCKFGFGLRAENLPNYALGLLASVIELINAGVVRVGGLKSRGFGRMRIENLRLSVYSPDHSRYGVSGGKLKSLDPIDSEATWRGSVEGSEAVAEGGDAKAVLSELIRAWERAVDRLRKVSSEGWKWSVASPQG